MSPPELTRHAMPAHPGRAEAPFWGWRIVALGILAQMLGLGLISAYGVFVFPVIEEFGAPMRSISLGFAAFMLVGGLLGPVLGPALDRRSIRGIMLSGVCVMWAALMLLSGAQALWQVGALLVVAAAGMMMFGSLPVHVLLVRWFAVHRGRALSIAALGVGLPGLFLPVLAAALIEVTGWRGAVAALATGCALLAVPIIAWLVIGHPRDVGQHPDGIAPQPGEESKGTDTSLPSSRELFGRSTFWLLALSLGLIFSAPIYHGLFLVPFLESIGVPRTRAALVLSGVAVFSILGKLGSAAISDRVDIRRLIWGLLALQGLSWLLLIARPSLEIAFLAALGFGLGGGGMMPMPPLLLSRCFGPQIFGRVAGLMGLVRLPFNVAVPFVGGWLIDLNGGGTVAEAYLPTFALGVGLLAIAGTILVALRVPARSAAGQSSS